MPEQCRDDGARLPLQGICEGKSSNSVWPARKAFVFQHSASRKTDCRTHHYLNTPGHRRVSDLPEPRHRLCRRESNRPPAPGLAASQPEPSQRPSSTALFRSETRVTYSSVRYPNRLKYDKPVHTSASSRRISLLPGYTQGTYDQQQKQMRISKFLTEAGECRWNVGFPCHGQGQYAINNLLSKANAER